MTQTAPCEGAVCMLLPQGRGRAFRMTKSKRPGLSSKNPDDVMVKDMLDRWQVMFGGRTLDSFSARQLEALLRAASRPMGEAAA